MDKSAAENQEDTGTTITDALIDGLRLNDPRILENAIEALTRIGPNIVPGLYMAVERKTTRPAHRARLRQVAQHIESHGRQSGNESRAVMDFLIDSLRVSNKSLNTKAADALCRLPVEIVGQLVTAAVLNRRKPGYCCRLLDVVDRIGKFPDFDCHTNLAILARMGNKTVRVAATGVLLGLNPAEPRHTCGSN